MYLTDNVHQDVLLQSLLNNAKEKARQKNSQFLKLVSENSERPLPSLHPGELPPPYFEKIGQASVIINDPDVLRAEAASCSSSPPPPPPPPPSLKQRKAIRNQTAGPSWFDLPAPPDADLPRLHREVEALSLRNQLDPKRFYRKDDADRKGIKGLPKHFAIGTIVTTNTPFGTASTDNLPRAHRKRTLVDELVDDAEARRYSKSKFNDLQALRGASGKNTLHQKRALRKPKW